MKRPLSALARPGIIEDLESTTFDLLIIGGGITGAGIAWDAAKRGIKTALIERDDFAFGTSSRSTKLIHGGLRYLKKGEVGLVREVGREREWLYGSAPHLLKPMPMLLPLYKGGTFGYWTASMGLYIYDRLAGVDKKERRVMQHAGKAARQEPLLKGEGLKGGGLYYEYRSDDARLTVEVLKTAVRHGAWVVNYVEAGEFLYYQSKLCGVKAIDRLTGQEVEIRARRIVNAAGPWVDLVRARDHALKGKRLLLTKGVHLVVDHKKLPIRQAAYFDAPDDGRMIFVIPRGTKTYIGTTDTVYTGNLEGPRVTEADRDYLLKAVEHIFPRIKLQAEDVESMWAGLRPLIRQEGKKPSDISRKDEIWESPSGLITIAGGKLTGFRKMAEKAVNMIARSLEREALYAHGPCTTAKEALSGGGCGRFETYGELREQLLLHGVRKGLPLEAVNYLLDLYGSNTADIYMRLEGLDSRFKDWPREPVGETGGRARKREAARPQSQAPATELEKEQGELAPAAGFSEREPHSGEQLLRHGRDPLGRGATEGGEPGDRRRSSMPEGKPQTAEERAAWVQEWMTRDRRGGEKREAAGARGQDAAWGAGQADGNPEAAAEPKEVGAESGSLQEADDLTLLAAGEPLKAGSLGSREPREELSLKREEKTWQPEEDSKPVPPEEKLAQAWRMLEEMTEQAKAEGKIWAASSREAQAEQALLRTEPPEAQAVTPDLSYPEPKETIEAEAAEVRSESFDQRDVYSSRDLEENGYPEPAALDTEGVNAEPAGEDGQTDGSWDGALQGEDSGGEKPPADVDYLLLKAEIGYCIEEEMTVHAADFLVRRTGMLYFNRERAEEIAIDVIEIMAEKLGWSGEEILNQKLKLAKEWENATVAAVKEPD